MTRTNYFKLVGVAILPALAVSVIVILIAKAAGLPETVGERASQILFFPIFLGACHAWRPHFERAA